MSTARELILARQDDPNTAILFEDERWTYVEYVAACAERAALLLERREDGPLHVGVLLDNVPEFPIWLGAAALAGAVVVGINPTRRGAELARDIRHTDSQWLVTESAYRPLLEGLEHGVAADRVLDIDSDGYREALAAHRGAAVPDVEVDAGDISQEDFFDNAQQLFEEELDALKAADKATKAVLKAAEKAAAEAVEKPAEGE